MGCSRLVAKTETEKAVKSMPKAWIRLFCGPYNHLEEDRVAHDGDVIQVEAGRAEALFGQGLAVKASAPRKRKK